MLFQAQKANHSKQKQHLHKVLKNKKIVKGFKEHSALKSNANELYI